MKKSICMLGCAMIGVLAACSSDSSFKPADPALVAAAEFHEAHEVHVDQGIQDDHVDAPFGIQGDGRRLALCWAEAEFPPENAKDVVLAPRTVAELLRSLGDEGPLKVTLKDTQVIFEFGEMFFSSKLLNGVYPNYKQVVFSDCDNKIRVNREELIATLRRINVSTTPTTNAMRLVFENNLLTVQVTAPDVDEATDTVTLTTGEAYTEGKPEADPACRKRLQALQGRKT